MTLTDKTIELLEDLEEYLKEHEPSKEVSVVFLLRIKSVKEQLEGKNEKMS